MSIFNAKASNGAIYKIGTATVQVGGANAVFLNVDITMSRNISPIPTLGSGIHWAAQTPSGTLNVGTILTNDKRILSALGAEGDSCKPVSMTINAKDAVCTSAGVNGGATIDISGAYCSQLQLSVNASQGYIGQSLSAMFTELTIS